MVLFLLSYASFLWLDSWQIPSLVVIKLLLLVRMPPMVLLVVPEGLIIE